jgi:holo-[acyl-carrier protein] synthase
MFMVVGVGIDIVEVGRIAKAMNHEQFVRRILTEREEAVCKTATRIAGRWAAKEAIIKAVGLPLLMKNIEILNDPLGQPYVTIHDVAFDAKRLRIYVSITHEKTHAAGVAVVERAVMQVPMI